MDLYWLAVSFGVMAHTPPLYNPGLWGRGLSVHAHHQKTLGQEITRTAVHRWTGRPSFCAIGGP